MATLTPQAFAEKWGKAELSERASYVQHFLDLCAVLGQPAPAEIDPTGDFLHLREGRREERGWQGVRGCRLRPARRSGLCRLRLARRPNGRGSLEEPARAERGESRSAVTRRKGVVMGSLEEKRAQRLQFMNELYDAVDGLEGDFVDMDKFLGRLGFDFAREDDANKFQNIAKYLRGEGLIKTIDVESGAVVLGVALTHEGVREVEEARGEPDKPTDHFAPVNVVYAGTMINSAIQQGSPGATQSLTVVNQNSLQDLKGFVRSLQGSIDQLDLEEDLQAELEADLRTLEGQTASPKPKKEVVRPVLQSIQRILEGAAGNVTASGFLPTIEAISNNLS